MAWQQYSPYSWTPLTENDGDLGLNPPRYEDTAYHDYSEVDSGTSEHARTLSRGESYELDE